MFWILICVILIIAFYLFNNNRHQSWRKRGLKQQSFPFPILGDSALNLFGKYSVSEMVSEIYNRYPNDRYIAMYQLYKPILMLKDPELIKQLCVKDFDYFLDHSPFLPDDFDVLWSKNLFALRGQRWKDMRSTLSPSFTGSKMRQKFSLMRKNAENYCQNLSQSPDEILELELKDLFTRYTNDTIATTAFGIQCDSLKERENEFFVRGKQTTDFTGLWKTVKIILCLLAPIMGKVIDASLFDIEAKKFFRKIVRETVEYREKHKIERPDMISLLMHARKGTQNQEQAEFCEEHNFAVVEEHLEQQVPQKGKMEISIDDMVSQALIFFFGGFDTVSSAMCFMAYELALNPDIQQKLITELDEFRVLEKELTYDCLSAFPYLDMVVSETLRKWPPFTVVDRKCNKSYTIQPKHSDETPLNLTESDTIYVPIYPIHRDPKYWPNPEKFDPDRFSLSNKEKITPYTYLPFGAGPRNCIGSRFAIAEVKAIFYEILGTFEFVPIEKTCIPFVPNKRSFNMTSANGFWFGLKKRFSSIS